MAYIASSTDSRTQPDIESNNQAASNKPSGITLNARELSGFDLSHVAFQVALPSLRA